MQAVDGDVLECARGDQPERALELGFVEVEGVVGDGDGGAVEGGEEDEDFAEIAGGVSMMRYGMALVDSDGYERGRSDPGMRRLLTRSRAQSALQDTSVSVQHRHSPAARGKHVRVLLVPGSIHFAMLSHSRSNNSIS